MRINSKFIPDSQGKIDCDLIEFAALAHDLGHPPFGHLGEEALDEKMVESGGFEGNAQTLRILGKLEKRHLPEGTNLGIGKRDRDLRIGLNLTHRSIASILKYDQRIPAVKSERKKLQSKGDISGISPVKGYYRDEDDLVTAIKESVLGKDNASNKLKTVECQIMDIADDIAYSCYDLEDSFKAGFLAPLQLVTLPETVLEFVARKAFGSDERKNLREVQKVLQELLNEIYAKVELKNVEECSPEDILNNVLPSALQLTYETSYQIASCGYQRTAFTSKLVGRFIESVKFDYNKKMPVLSAVSLAKESRLQVEILKQVTFASQILSPKLKIVERRGKEIVGFLFDTLSGEGGEDLLPEDHQQIVAAFEDKDRKKRAVCDFISGMTDRYALEFYSRLKSENPQTIFKPL